MRRILITGANKGIGRAAVAAVLGAYEDTFVYLGSRDRGRGDAARDALVSEQPSWAERIEVLTLDVSDDASVEHAASATQPLYGIVNNAGIGFGDYSMETVLNVNARGPKRVCDAFLGSLDSTGRIVNVASASGPMFLAKCSAERQLQLTNPQVTWAQIEAVMNECLELASTRGNFAAAGLGAGDAYGLSKACLNAYTIELARNHPKRTINSCTPGFIATDMTRHFARGSSPEAAGMKPPSEGTKAIMHLLFGDVGGTGWYFGSDAVRSPLDAYRSPGAPAYKG